VLVDTGIGEGDPWVDEHYRPRVRDVGEALRGAALQPADVRTIVHTHLHFDHCGQDRAFPGVPIVVQRAEREAANVAGHTVPGLVGFPGARYELIDGDSEIAPGMSVLATPGHTIGHQSVVVRTDDGLVLVVGQAAQDARSFATGEADESVKRLRALEAERIHFSHDRAVLRRRAPVAQA
jgi:N-acyl homoserine lactone hydrolase